jgi:hypothetical protein
MDSYLKPTLLVRHQWLISVILATQEAMIRRIGSKPAQANS